MYRAKIFIPILFVTLIVGVFIGNSVLAGGAAPGSKDDPLVTKAYVENSMNSQLSMLQQQVVQLQAEANTLRQQVAFLESKVGQKAPVQTQPQANPVTPQQQQQQQPPQTQPKQKVAYVQQSNNYVNARVGPGTNYDIAAKVNKGSKMIVIDEKDSWYRVKLEDGKLAWVANWVVDVREE
ncbi:MAG: SH3 domain-containing protein [Bacillota bacterium]